MGLVQRGQTICMRERTIKGSSDVLDAACISLNCLLDTLLGREESFKEKIDPDTRCGAPLTTTPKGTHPII